MQSQRRIRSSAVRAARRFILPAAGTGICALALAGAAPLAPVTPLLGETFEFEEVEIFIEINATDGDAGLQIFLDGDGWERVTMRHPDRRKLLEVASRGEVRDQSLTEMFFESSEPSFDEQPLEEFLKRFPEGVYTFQGKSSDGHLLAGEAELTHALPEQPEILWPPEDSVLEPEDVFVSWAPVPDPPGSEIVCYEVLVNAEEADPPTEFSVIVPPDVFMITPPAEYLQEGTIYKVEILAREASGNRTITELEFETDD